MTKRLLLLTAISSAVLSLNSCAQSPKQLPDNTYTPGKEFNYEVDRFADAQVLRYQVHGFDQLSLQQKKLCYYLYEAALSGRDIIYDQNYKYNIVLRKVVEQALLHYEGDRNSKEWKAFEVWAKRMFFSNGIHHHYSMAKFEPGFDQWFWVNMYKGAPKAQWPLEKGEKADNLMVKLSPLIFDKSIAAKRVNQTSGQDLLTTSAMNFYEGVTQTEAEAFYKAKSDAKDAEPISHGLNSKLVKVNGALQERIWKINGMYGEAISKIVYWLEKAVTVAETPEQKKSLELLVKFYKTGDLKVWDAYNIAWVKDTEARVDVVNGFIEVYGDPLGYRASYESVVSIKDLEATKRIGAIAKEAQWFEDNSPILAQHKKKQVTGITAKAITVVVEAGDAAPTTPIGINLPNANWIRQKHGSKSVSLSNIVEAYDVVRAKGNTLKEFAYDQAEIDRAKAHGVLAGYLHTDMHEVIGHASGQISAGVGTPKETLKNYASSLEEGRADLVALYYMLDPKLVEMGVMPSLEVGKAEYDGYIRNGLMLQLNRLELGEDLEEAHMRNRQLVAAWVYEKGKAENVIEKVVRDGKTYFVIRDYDKLRKLFGDLLRELQRVISEGDYKAGQALMETYGVKVDKAIHKEVKERYATLNVAPYMGFIQPKLVPVMKGKDISDVKVVYQKDFIQQHLEFGKNYGFLPVTR